MDQAILVSGGHKLLDRLEASGMKVRAAVWVHNTDMDSWRLWIVPEKTITDKRDFYRRVADIISLERDEMSGIDTSDTEMVAETHPLMAGLKSMIHVPRRGNVMLSSNMVNGFYLPDGIVLTMDL